MRIQLNSDGFVIIGRDSSIQVPWASVKEICALKRDLLTYDTIRLAFRVSADGNYVEVDEGDTGYGDLVQEIERRFEIVDKDWWHKVAFPAFGTNRTTIWHDARTERS